MRSTSPDILTEGLPAPVDPTPHLQLVTPPQPAPDQFRWLISGVLRGGVLTSAALLLTGMLLGAIEHVQPGQSASSPTGLPALGGLLHLVSAPGVLVSCGLLLLIVLPIARVALSLLHFGYERDRLYVALTAVVLAILVAGIVSGKAL